MATHSCPLRPWSGKQESRKAGEGEFKADRFKVGKAKECRELILRGWEKSDDKKQEQQFI
jgi:hypothetical protein